MKVIQGSVAILANAVNTNVISGNAHEFVEEACLINIGVCGSAIGISVDPVIGGNAVGQNMAINLQNRFPVYPDDFAWQNVPALQGNRIVLQARNTTAGTLTIFWCIQIIPLGVGAR